MAHYIITIDVVNYSPGSFGNFKFDPALLRVQPGDTVVWQCVWPFVLEFKDGTPVGQMQVFPAPGTTYTSAPYIVGPKPGNFHYAVAIWYTELSTVFIDSACARLSVN